MSLENSSGKGRWKRYPKYKDSGFEWLGEVPEEWKKFKLKTLAIKEKFSFVDGPFGSDLKNEEYQDSGVPLIQLNNIGVGKHILQNMKYITEEKAESLKRHNIFPGQIIIAKMADPVARATRVSDQYEKYVFVADGVKFIPDQQICDFDFLTYAINSKNMQYQAELESTGTTRLRIGLTSIKNLHIILPELQEQITTVTFLDRETARIDAILMKRERQIELLQEMRAALISHVVVKGLDPNVKMNDSGIEWIGKIPEHWEIIKNKWIYKEIDERSISGDEELLTVSHITGVTPRSEKNVNMFLPLSFEGYKVCKKDDLAINTMWAFMGALGFSPCDGIVSPSYNIYRFKRENVSKYFDFLYRTPTFICEIFRHSKGVWTSRLRIYPDEFLRYCHYDPPVYEQKMIVEHINSIIEYEKVQIKKIQQSIDLLRESRTALISAAVTGKIDVRQEISA